MAIAGQLSLLLAAASVLSPAPVALAAAIGDWNSDNTAVDYNPSLEEIDLIRRASSDSPNGYTPSKVNCPAQLPTIRDGSTISPQEKSWLQLRRNETVAPMLKLLSRISIPNFDINTYFQDIKADSTALPNIGIAISGGGYRALLNGAGALAAWDSRSEGNEADGSLGGLLQSATYISGLSGGSWLLGSLYTNNFMSVQDSLKDGKIWQFGNSIIKGPIDKVTKIIAYYADIESMVHAKSKTGFETSITDYWGRMLSYQLIKADEGGPGYTFSSIADDSSFQSGSMPLPLITAVGRAPGETVIATNSTVFELSPWEMGSFNPSLQGFAPMKYVGSSFSAGQLTDGKCVVGFDNAGFVMGTSSSLFNQVVLQLDKYAPKNIPKLVLAAIKKFLEHLGSDYDDIADWKPNPFKGWNPSNNLGANSDRLSIVDGGEDGQNIPFHPHLFPERQVDVVFSVDSSADTNNWPDGSAVIATYRRSLEASAFSNGTGFPSVPGRDTFLNLGLNTKPVFFGCDSSNLTSPAPLIVYLPNYSYTYSSNIPTLQMTINNTQRDAIVQNGWALATQVNGARDQDWPVCIGCAMLSRSFDRTQTEVPDKCRQCFSKYCWDGTLNETSAAV